jgi:midasin (ATPase involved in ribosome maturation)
METMLVGPAGSGKTTVCHAVADALSLPFYAFSVGMQTTKTDLLGFVDANGIYRESVLYQAYKNGGVFLLDEIDAGNSNVLTILNAMLANGQYIFPNGERVGRNPDFVCFAAANTFGRGADRQYVGRNQLDAATLDRFVVRNFDYDEALERALTGNDDWCERVQAYRKASYDLKERIVISPRASIKGATLLAAGFKLKEVEEMVLWKGIDRGIVQKIKTAANIG